MKKWRLTESNLLMIVNNYMIKLGLETGHLTRKSFATCVYVYTRTDLHAHMFLLLKVHNIINGKINIQDSRINSSINSRINVI